jgi:peptidoglycan/xylan/chitin deacetylase (PgdA/CDA1 family)
MIRNPIPWPNGAKCAVAFTFDVDADSTAHINWLDQVDDHVASVSLMRYGPEIAVPRLIDMFDAAKVPLTFFVPGWVAENYPETMRMMVDSGAEIGHHGYLHDDPNKQSPEAERETMVRGIEILESFTGKKPVGYRSPTHANSRHTLDLLVEHGFLYESSLLGDDIPYEMESGKGGRVVEIPCAHGLDDWPNYMVWRDFNYFMSPKAPSDAYHLYKDEFDAAYRYGGMWMSVWHPLVSGRLARAHWIGELVEYMKGHEGVWFCTLEEIAAHVRALQASGAWTPRIDKQPWYKMPHPAVRDRLPKAAE